MLYDVSIRVKYRYDANVSASRDLVMLTPLDVANAQRVILSALTVDPKPDEWNGRRDFFGNNVVEIAFHEPHRDVTFALKARVERMASGPSLDLSPRLADLAGEIASHRSLAGRAPHHFVGASPRIPLAAETTRYARAVAGRAPSVLAAVVAVGEALHRDIAYRPGVTTVSTPLLDAFRARHGVCQDFTHIMIACLRGLAIPAGYVSGCLRTLPPPGEARLEGADATHAWVSAWCGAELGWVEYDPTNACLAGADHIVIAYGRDYGDVAPVRGVTRTAGGHSSDQAVDVIPVESAVATG
ncbi:transglutaminase family protein [Acuticoccus sp. M5D2P5]|uniref:transglutaminase family protein n=1 Tax=Acuticoccus kalidii TaxID=2910977 RepID=UPI001F37335C|nr:transglutaminase family protein [Acuticoccus kalidii]MCF3936600.1 transglutaminase family protein [Acuticoccus kalidii]